MASPIYLLCALTSAICAGLLLRAYRRFGSKLLFWSALCFVGLMVNNAILVADLVLFPSINMSFVRAAIFLVSMLPMLYGLICDSA